MALNGDGEGIGANDASGADDCAGQSEIEVESEAICDPSSAFQLFPEEPSSEESHCLVLSDQDGVGVGVVMGAATSGVGMAE